MADVDSTQEVQILTANYNAEYGRSAGGQIRIVTKSGGQEFHGTAYEYLRNSALNANSWTRNRLGMPCCDATSKADHCRRRRSATTSSATISTARSSFPACYNKDRNKLFWLWGQEWVRQRAARNTRSPTVPSLRMRSGNFSELLDPANRLLRHGDPRRSTNRLTGQPLPGNIIPTDRLSPNGLALIRAYPEPTPGFIGPARPTSIQIAADPTNQRKDTFSIDFYPNERHQFRWRCSSTTSSM